MNTFEVLKALGCGHKLTVYGWASGDHICCNKSTGKIVDGHNVPINFNNLGNVEWEIYIPPKAKLPEFKPFDQVLVRDNECDEWEPSIFASWEGGDLQYPYHTVGDTWKDCIPYKGSEALLGTTDASPYE